jgi:GT2 family glycosyltransferase
MQDVKISVIIVNWNGKKWLKKCLDSLYSQTYSNLEIIIVDNNSTDDSIEFIKKNFSSVAILNSETNLGFSGGNNIGIQKSTGDFILLLNNDTWLESDLITNLMCEYFSSASDIIAPHETEYINPTFKRLYATVDLLGHVVTQRNTLPSKARIFYLSGACLLFKKDFYIQTGGLDTDFFMYMEDVDWFWRMRLLNKKIHQSHDIFFYHSGAGSTGNGIKYNVFLWRNQNTLQMLLKNYKVLNLLWILPLYFIQNFIEMIFFVILLKPKISFSYVQGWIFNIVHIKRTLQKRKIIQSTRVTGDFAIFRKMYLGPGAFHHFIQYYFE